MQLLYILLHLVSLLCETLLGPLQLKFCLQYDMRTIKPRQIITKIRDEAALSYSHQYAYRTSRRQQQPGLNLNCATQRMTV